MKYIKNDIQESAQQVHDRRSQATEISEKEFIEAVGDELWAAFSTEIIEDNQSITGFFKSNISEVPCYYVEIGNVDRISSAKEV